MEKLKVLDLFAGIGGFTFGLHKTNLYETVAFCEWDEKAKRVLSKNFPKVYCFGDIKNLSYKNKWLFDKTDEAMKHHKPWEYQDGPTNIDVITGGFPCQDISYAGKGAGLEGERSGHWYDYKRLIEEIRPKGVIIENVSALRTRGLGTVLQHLHEIGYDAEWHCIPASYFGACHQRDRIWILAYLRCEGGERLVPFQHPGTVGQGGWGGKEDLQQVYSNPFGRSDCWPEPLIRRMDVPLPGRVDRLKQVGNSVYWPIVEALGNHLYDNLVRCGLVKTTE
jgi:DNA (cytosine-5)-methyltransferase 1